MVPFARETIAFPIVLPAVMAGLVPAIHVVVPHSRRRDGVDGRSKSGHDGKKRNRFARIAETARPSVQPSA